MALRVYNSLSRTKEPFEPLVPGRVGIYLCGPTVYKPAHIGHMVGPVIFDTVKRYLVYKGYEVTLVVNITDVDDKLINRAAETGTSVEDLAQRMTEDYLEHLQTMGVDSVDHFPKATEHIDDMLRLIGSLIDSGHAYPLDGDVYFEVARDDDYGRLSRRNVEDLLAGSRIAANARKKHPADFALWKASRPGEPAWDSPWGPGRPGWHVECSAMSMKYLGESFDIHGGGLDLLFPHHENELAQSESCTGKPFARYWMHNGLMQSASAAGKIGGGHDRHGDLVADQQQQEANKLAGSRGAASVAELFENHDPETIRFFVLATHYRSPIELSEERISEVDRSLAGFYRLFETFERITATTVIDLPAAERQADTVDFDGVAGSLGTDLVSLRDRFLEAMDDDFNTGAAVGVLFELRTRINAFIGESGFEAGDADDQAIAGVTAGLTLVRELGGILGVFGRPVVAAQATRDDGLASQLIELLISLRDEARAAKNFELGDAIRDRLVGLGVTLEDRPDGTRFRID